MQTPLAISASVLAIVLWLVSRRRPLWSSQTPASPAALDRSALVVTARSQSWLADSRSSSGSARPGLNQLNRRQRLLGLSAQLNGAPEQRLLALVQLSGTADRSVLPLLRRALRDPDLKVMAAAAAAIGPYRACPAKGVRQPAAARQRLPRNAAPRA
ncbi:MAG: hypothetical protein RLZZ336_2150 [Cyanobacteriota bacterium]|jgi:hypothetical protein